MIGTFIRRAGLAAGLLAGFGVAANAGDWIADTKSGCKIWNPRPSPGETVGWAGACKDGFAEGKGVLDWIKGGKPYERDEGEWHGGRQRGQGTQSWPGGRYSGQLADGLPHGNGLLVTGEAQYSGSFLNGVPNGEGTLINPSGTYSGNWQTGCFNDGKRRTAFGVSLASCS
jgi:MORN repeat